jgi:hypothetical protein
MVIGTMMLRGVAEGGGLVSIDTCEGCSLAR